MVVKKKQKIANEGIQKILIVELIDEYSLLNDLLIQF